MSIPEQFSRRLQISSWFSSNITFIAQRNSSGGLLLWDFLERGNFISDFKISLLLIAQLSRLQTLISSLAFVIRLTTQFVFSYCSLAVFVVFVLLFFYRQRCQFSQYNTRVCFNSFLFFPIIYFDNRRDGGLLVGTEHC